MSKLVIKFRCLCFFARDERSRQVHVLTPASCGCHGGSIDEHNAFLVFPREGGRLNAAGNFKGAGEKGKADFVEMEGWAITFAGNDSPADLGLRPSVVNLNDVAGDSLDPALVTGPRDQRITSRITLRNGGVTGSVTPGTWTFAGRTGALARDVFWTLDGLPDEPLVVRRSRFEVGQEPNPEGDDVVAEIRPNQRGEFRLQFHHALKGDFGHPLVVRDPDVAKDHFRAYYNLYDRPASTPLPVFIKAPDTGTIGCIIGGGSVRG